MDFEKKIKQIAIDLNGKLRVKKDTCFFLDGHSDPFESYIIELTYKNSLIIITNTIGVQASGNVTCYLDNNVKLIDFEIDSTSHFINLFLRKTSRFNVKSIHENFKNYLKQHALKELEPLSLQTAFDPLIFTKKQDDAQLIITEYHLAYYNSPLAIKPLVRFYQKVIDFLSYKAS